MCIRIWLRVAVECGLFCKSLLEIEIQYSNQWIKPSNLSHKILRFRGIVNAPIMNEKDIRNSELLKVFFRSLLKIFFQEIIKEFLKISLYFFSYSFKTFLLQKLLQWFLKLVLENPARISSGFFLQILSETLIMILEE